ncbi:transglutaminaseTgpA domain-containing protein [Neptuniibacter sp. QD48_11]|uniref:transglutaminase family protein n=1 Tax=unclassified Neptuniibacter TaxID=2630693 RepID=UPI0039F5FDC3
MATQAMHNQQLSRTALLWQLISVFVVVLPHISHLPVWVPVIVLFTLSWRVMVFIGRWSFPAKWFKSVLVFVAGASVLLSYQEGGGISSTVSLLVVAFSLKLLEIYKRRDALVVLYVAYLIAASIFLFTQTIWMAIYTFFCLLVVSTALQAIHIHRAIPFFQPFKRTSLMFVPVFPLMIVLFMGMPRIDPLWQISFDKSAAKTGLSDTMAPGDITQLTRSAEVAFRATFEGVKPPQSSLYWRAIVLHDFDGRNWSNKEGSLVNRDKAIESERSSTNISYELILEPTQATYVPALDYVSNIPRELEFRAGRVLETRLPLAQRKQFSLEAKPTFLIGAERNYQSFFQELNLPEGNPDAMELARQWWRETGNEEAFIQRILKFFNQSFIYTLSPPPLGVNTVDDFLFKTQRGFCGHYSSATAFMLRAVGIPARIVTGYQGGEWNHYENYLLVRQYDAHAWVEAWLPKKGWIRVDPTAAVSPDRIEEASSEVLSREPEFLNESPWESLGIKNDGFLALLRLRIEGFNYAWHRWVLHYHHRQIDLLRDLLGEVTAWRLVLLLLIPFAIVITITMLLMARSSAASPQDPFDSNIARLSNGLKSKGLQRSKGETVGDYCLRLANVRPDLADVCGQIAKQYECVKYAAKGNGPTVSEFSKSIDQCLISFR